MFLEEVIEKQVSRSKTGLDSFPFGKILRSFNGGSKYGHQGSQRESELSDNEYYTHFRGLDDDIARWKQVDPKSDVQLSWSPYVSMDNNPVINTDVYGDIVEYEKFRDRVNSFFSRVFNKDYRDKFDGWDKSADIFTLSKNVNGRGSLAKAEACEGACINGVQHNTVDYDRGFTSSDISNKGLRGVAIPFEIAFKVGQLPVAALSGLGIGMYNIFSKHDVGWGWGNRISTGENGGNLLSWGLGNYNKYNMFGQKLSGSGMGSSRINPEGLLGFRVGVGKSRSANFLDIGPEIPNRKGTMHYLHFNFATEGTRNLRLHRENVIDTHN